jgi:hypothetical protein
MRLYEYWRDFVQVCKKIKPNELWVVGDACDGTNVFADKTRRMLTANLDEQKAMFVELFKEFLYKDYCHCFWCHKEFHTKADYQAHLKEVNNHQNEDDYPA